MTDLTKIATELASKAKETAGTNVKANANKTMVIKGHRISHDASGTPSLASLKRLPADVLLRYIDKNTKVKKGAVTAALVALITVQEANPTVGTPVKKTAESTKVAPAKTVNVAPEVSDQHKALLLIVTEAIAAASMSSGKNADSIMAMVLKIISSELPNKVLAAAKKATQSKYGSTLALHQALGNDGDNDNAQLNTWFKQIKVPGLKTLAVKAGKIIAAVDAEEGDGKFKGFK